MSEGAQTRPDPPFDGPGVDALELDAAKAALKRRLFGSAPAAPCVGRFTILEPVGRGTMGTVYAAWDPTLDRKVALKLIPIGERALADSRRLDEARALARVASPFVVTVHEVGTDDGRLFIVMEFVDGGTIRSWLRDGERTDDEVLDVFDQAAAGLAAVHDAGLSHRDFKPDNVLLDRGGRALVADFGLAVTQAWAGDASTTVVPGTPAYIAPETVETGDVDPRSDQYAYCVSLHEALAGHRPVDSKLDEAIPPWIATVLRRGLSRRPAERFASMEELRGELARGRSAPGARRRRLAMGAAGAGIAALSATVVGFALRTPADPAQCTTHAAEDRLETVWDEDKRGEMRRAFDSDGQPWASTTLTSVSGQFDEYAGQWQRAWVDNCEASRIRGEQSMDALDRRTACLNVRLDRLDAAVSVLTSSSLARERATQVTASLPPISDCEDMQQLASIMPLARDSDAAAVASARSRLATFAALLDGGAYSRAGEEFGAWRSTADLPQFDPLLAEVSLIEGRVALRTGEPGRAATALEQAFTHAIGGRHHAAGAEAAIRLVQVLGDESSDREAAERWVILSRAQIRALPRPSDYLAGWVELNWANTLQRWGDYTGALEAYEVAEARWGESASPVDLAGLANNRGNTLGRLGRIDEAVESFDQAITIWTEQVGAQHPLLAMAYMNRGSKLKERGDYEPALADLERALAIDRAGLGDDHPYVAADLTSIGALAMRTRDLDGAAEAYSEALEILERAHGEDHPRIAGAVHNLGTVHEAKGEMQEARALYLRALELKQTGQGQDSPKLASTLIGLGRLDRAEGNYAQAVSQHQRALELLESGSEPHDPVLAEPLLELGLDHLGADDLRPAHRRLSRALELRATASVAPEDRAAVEWAMAQCLAGQGQFEQARAMAARAQTSYREGSTVFEADADAISETIATW